MELKYMQQLKDNPKLSHRIYLKGLDEKKYKILEISLMKGKSFLNL